MTQPPKQSIDNLQEVLKGKRLRTTVAVNKTDTAIEYEDLADIIKPFEQIHPEAYGYTDNNVNAGNGIDLYRLFRNREESFKLVNPHVQIWYQMEGYKHA